MARPLDVRAHGGEALWRRELLDQRVLWREDHEGGAPQRVWPGGEDDDLVITFRLEGDLRALGAPDPVRLHGHDALWPVEAGEVEELVGVIGDAVVPLWHEAPLDEGAGAVTTTVDHLFVGEHRLIDGVPVDERLLAVGQALLEHLHEEPLVPLVVLRVAGDDALRPVEHRAHLLELLRHAVDALVREACRVHGGVACARGLDGGVLCRKAEGVVAHGEEDVEAAHALVARCGVGWRLGVPVTYVQVARRVRVHGEEVVLRSDVVVQVDLVEAFFAPALLPLLLDGLRRVALGVPRGVGAANCLGHDFSSIGRGSRRAAAGRPLEVESGFAKNSTPAAGPGSTRVRSCQFTSAARRAAWLVARLLPCALAPRSCGNGRRWAVRCQRADRWMALARNRSLAHQAAVGYW